MNLSKRLFVISLLNLSFAVSASEHEGRRTPCCNLKRSLKTLAVACVALFATGNAQSTAVEVVPQKVYQPTPQELRGTGVKCTQLRVRTYGSVSAARLTDPLCHNDAEGYEYVRGSLERLLDGELAELTMSNATCYVKNNNNRDFSYRCIPSARMINRSDLVLTP